jgi:hypothetical protein
VLYQTVARHWPEFSERAEEAGGLPGFVTEEFESYLRCGLLEHGGVLLSCERCGDRRAVAFSCKKRGLCPSCVGRRMNDVAYHLVDRVLPRVGIRQWVCTLPFGLRALCGYDRELCTEVLGAFVGTVMEVQRRRAKFHLGLGSLSEAHPGAVTFVQRFDSALRLNVHAHLLCPDGVYVEGEGGLEYRELPEPTPDDVQWVAEQTWVRIGRATEALGRSLKGFEEDSCPEPTVLGSCCAASAQGLTLFGDRAGQPALRLMPVPRVHPREPDPLSAEVGGVNVHAQVFVEGHDRDRLERLCRYLGRPAISEDRLSVLEDGRIRVAFKKAWSDGTSAAVLSPMDFMARLIALVPPPRFHLLRYAGVLAPHSRHRKAVVPSPPIEPPLQLLLFGDGTGTEALAKGKALDAETTGGRHRWAWLLKRTFKEDVTVCPRCDGKLRLVEVATSPAAIERLMAAEGARTVRIPRAPPSGQLRFSFGP